MLRRRFVALCALAASGGLAGCTNDDGEDDSGSTGSVYRQAFRDALTDEGIEVRALTNEDGRVELTYAPGGLGSDADEDDYEARIEETVGIAAEAYFDRVYGGWDVTRLDATVEVEESVVATWRMESEWIQRYLDGDISRDELGAKVEESVERHTPTPSG